MLEGKGVIRDSDMSKIMQSNVMELAYKALDLHEVSDYKSIAHYIKQKLDEDHEPAWQCVVGKEFGCSISHMSGTFLLFHVEFMEFLVFKDANDYFSS